MNRDPDRSRLMNAMRPRTAALAVALVLGGCAAGPTMHDPLEAYNRGMFSINDGLDKVAFRPFAQGYQDLVPGLVRTGISNFFGNLYDVWTGFNNLLQGKVNESMDDASRVLVNTTVGMLGLFDIASDLGLEKHEEDFGQTLGRWGIGGGPYVVWPFFGGRTLRDSVGLAVDYKYDLIRYADDNSRFSMYTARFLDTRAALIPAEKVLEEAALDKYAYVRDAYLQRRRHMIYDGRPPRDDDEDAAAKPLLPGTGQLAVVAQPAESVPSTREATSPLTAPGAGVGAVGAAEASAGIRP